MRHGAWAGVALLWAACTDLPAIEPNRCGNKVLEEGEYCDTFAGDGLACGAPDSDSACLFVCDPDQSIGCPEGWACGNDRRCRYPTGQFTPASGSPWRFKVSDLALGDVDGDGNADLVGNDQSTIKVRFGSAQGEFGADLDMPTRLPMGPLDFTYFSADARLDAVVPTFGGLFVMLGEADRSLAPVAYSPFDLPADAAVVLVPLEADPGNLNTELLILAGGGMGFVGSTGGSLMPLGHDTGELVGRAAVADLDLGPDGSVDGRDELALAFADAQRVWIYGSQGVPPASEIVERQQVFLPAPIYRGARFADVDGDRALDLMVSVGAAGDEHVAVAYGDGAGRFESLAGIELVFDQLTPSPWPLAAGYLDYDYKYDYVCGDAIVIADQGVAAEEDAASRPPLALVPTAFRSAEPWAEAVIADFNGDHIADAATSVDGADGIDFYLGSLYGVFNKFHVNTADPPFALRAGDFDGDYIGDLAFGGTRFRTHPDALSVAYGNPGGGPSDPVFMGALGLIEAIEPLNNVMDAESIDLMTDLVVVSLDFDNPDARAVALMQGSSERRLLSPFSLLTDPTALADVPVRAMAGNFDLDGIKDLAAIARPQQNVGPLGGGQEGGGDGGGAPFVPDARLWLVPGQGGEGGLNGAGKAFKDLPFSDFDPFCAVWAVGDLDGDGRDEMVGIDGELGCYGYGFMVPPRLLIASLQGDSLHVATQIAEAGYPFSAVRRLMLRDLDADGDLDLLALFAGELFSVDGTTGPGAPPGAGVVVLWNDGALSFDAASSLLIPDAVATYAVVPVDLDADRVPELAVLAEGGIWVSRLDEDALSYAPPEWILFQVGDGQLAVGDVNGDGLQDLAWTEGPDVQVALQLDPTQLGTGVMPDRPAGGGGP